MRVLLVISLFLLVIFPSHSQLRINEVSASNYSGVSDEEGETADWIEILNTSSGELNLDGYGLSDEVSNPLKWQFPAISLGPGDYLFCFASGKNRKEMPLAYRTIIDRGAQWKYLVPDTEPPAGWKSISFNASSWNEGVSGFGYGDNDDATVLSSIRSVFIRREFILDKPEDIEQVILSIDYDDGFIAYLNGTEIARANLGEPGTPVSFDQIPTGLREATMYNGGDPENILVTDPASILVQGVNVIAVQAHNAENSSDLSLIPMLTLGLTGPSYTDDFPSYINLKPRHFHTNFKISREGEILILATPQGKIEDSLTVPVLLADISYGRKPDGSSSFFYFNQPTPGSANTTTGFTTASADTVKFSIPGGYFSGMIQVELSTTDANDTILYTLDGSDPSPGSTVYANPVMISNNTVIRARVLNSDKLPGRVSTSTWLTREHTLPVACISTTPDNLWDWNSGIYVLGPNASPDNPNFGANFWQDWEKRAHLEYFDKEGIKVIDQEVGIKIFGAWSRANAQKSLALFARKEYGNGSLDYKFFEDKPIESFESLVLRNGGNDWAQAMVRDGLASTLVRDTEVDRQAFQPVIVYINGEYWGIHNLREKVNTNYLAENHFVNPDSVDLLESGGNIVDGSNTEYLKITTFLESNSLENEQDYLQVSSKIDINNYIQYQLTQIYINNHDWPGNNIKFWKSKTDGLWRWIMFDTDFGFSIWEEFAYNTNTLQFALASDGPDWPNPPWSTLLFRRMISNPGFRGEFINQYADRLNTNFASDRVLFVIDSLQQLFMPEIQDHTNRWSLSYENWDYNYGVMENYARYRPSSQRNHIRFELNAGSKLDVKIEVSPPGSGKVKVNSVIPANYPFNGVYFQDLPIRLTAIPQPGYRFETWEGAIISGSRTITYNMEDPGSFRAVFVPSQSDEDIVIINELRYASPDEKNPGDWIELYNNGETTVNLKGWVISDGSFETGFTISKDFPLYPGSWFVICRDKDNFHEFYPWVNTLDGDFGFGLSSNGDDVNLFDPDGKLVDNISYTPNLPWPDDVPETWASIALSDPSLDNNEGSNWFSCRFGGTPGRANICIPMDGKKDLPVAQHNQLDCFPNPFKDFTTVRVEVTEGGTYSLDVYDLKGSLIRSLDQQYLEPGIYYMEWDGRSDDKEIAEGGVYLVRLSGFRTLITTKLVYLR